MGDCVYEYCKNIDENTLDNCAEQIKKQYENFESLSPTEKGDLIGKTIGKNGVDIFAGIATVKGVATFRNLKAANRVCNLEAMASSTVNKELMISSSIKHASDRKNYLTNIKYNFDSHNKHVYGHNDFLSTRSVWEHQDPEGLLRKFSGTGRTERGIFGAPGYKETVDFKEHIGIWKKGNIELPTTRGTIHYGEKGAHIVPSNPNPIYRGKE